MLFAVAGMMLMAVATDLLVIFLALEVFSLAVYVLTGLRRARVLEHRRRLQVLPARRVLERVLPVRHRVHLRARGQHAPRPGDGGRPGPGDDRQSAAARGDGPAAGRVRLQGGRRAVPHVDAGRLRGGAHGGDGLHVDRRQGGRRSRCSPACSCSALEPLRADWTPVLWVLAVCTMILGYRRRRGADQPQADARVFEHRARRVPAGGAGRGRRDGPGVDPLLPAWCTPSPTSAPLPCSRCSARARRRWSTSTTTRACGTRSPALAGAAHRLPAVARRVPADGRLRREVVRVQRRRRRGPVRPRHHRRADQRRLGLLLPAHRRHDVHVGAARRLPLRRSVPGSALAALSLSVVALFYLGVLPTRVLDLAARSVASMF